MVSAKRHRGLRYEHQHNLGIADGLLDLSCRSNAERRGRSFKIWAWIAVIVGPLALPLVLLFPTLHGKDGDGT
jgi:hypothetical protein